jgi:hypothetical protein
MPKYDPRDYRCKDCGDFYHTEKARDACEAEHREEQ